MINLKKILYPTDFSDDADHARIYAVELAKKFGANVVVMHAVPPPTYAVGYDLALPIMTEINDQLHEAAQVQLEKAAELIRQTGVEVETVLCGGSAFVEIITTARSREIDLIVIGTHGIGAIKHVLLGSTAERVVRKAPCPVLTIRNAEREFVTP